MSIVTVSNLTFGYDSSPENVFEDVSFRFDTDWKLGFVGRNGRGKTTFLKLLMGEHEYSGRVQTTASFSYFPFPVDDLNQTAIDIIDKLDPNYEFWELCRELNLAGVPEETLFRPFGTLSYGERTKILLAAMFIRHNHFLLLDEPTNHLDQTGKRIIADYLAAKKGFLLVSHDRMLLDAVTDHTLSINKTNIEIQSGGFSQWLENKERQDQFELEENKKLTKEISRLKGAARQTSNWSDKVEATKTGEGPVDRGFIGHKSAKMMKRTKSIEARQNNAIEKKSGLMKNIETTGTLKLSPLQYHTAVLAELSGLSITYGENALFRNFNLTIRQGDRIALSGENGSGKSSILKLIMGEDIPHTGAVRIGSGLKISYVLQDTSGLSGDMLSFAKSSGVDYTLFLTILRHLGLEREQFETDLCALSEGQKKKVLLAKSLAESAHLYVWDEPLNYIDIQSRMQIETLLQTYAPSMIFVEHDAMFVKQAATEAVSIGIRGDEHP